MKKIVFILTGLFIAVVAYPQWSLTGNAGTNTSNFLGTTDNKPLLFKVNNQTAGFTGYPDKNNVSFGYHSLLHVLTEGVEDNTVVGSYAMPWSQASRNVAVGRFALESSFTGDENVAIGWGVLGEKNYPGTGNVAIGSLALRKNEQSYNIGIGFQAALHNSTAEGITAIGFKSLWHNTTGEFNTALGHNSLMFNSTGYWNVALGSGSLYSNTTGRYNTAGGSASLFFNSTGEENTAFGQQALGGNIDGSYNTAVGCMALWSVRFVGYDEGYGHGSANTALGYEAIKKVTTGGWNVGVGVQTMYENSTGSENSTLGAQSLFSNTTGNKNIAVGNAALRASTTGSYNVAVGAGALITNTTGNYNIAIGHEADTKKNNFTNAIAIGYRATATASNQVRIGNNSVSSIGGVVAWSNLSDSRSMKNVNRNIPGLNFIKKLQPVSYNLDLETEDNKPNTGSHTGFVAQEVKDAVQSIGFEFGGIDIDESGNYALRYSEFIAPLVKAVQEISVYNESLQQKINQLEEVNSKLTELVNQMADKLNIPGLSMNKIDPVQNASLEQNFPNPFNQSTTINYSLLQKYNSAKIVISDTSGKICLQETLTGTGTGNITISAGSLPVGIYYYSLVVDNMLVDTKKMIVVNG